MSCKCFAQTVVVSAVVAVAFCAGAASAQTAGTPALVPTDTTYDIQQYYGRGKNVSVLERERPDYQAVGIQTGGFTLYPLINIGAQYDDNVFATDASKRSDGFLVLNPTLTAQSNWGRHGVRLYGSLLNEDYANYHTENQLAYILRADGRIDVHGDSYINIGADAQKAYEPRGNVYSTSDEKNPVHYDTEGIYARGLYAQDRIRLAIGTEFRRFDYANDQAVDGTTIDEASRNQDIWRVDGRGDYALSPDTAVFAKAIYLRTTYDLGTSLTRRDSDSYSILGGVNFDLTALARGEIGLGYSDRQYDSSAYKKLSGFAVAAKLEYFPTQLLTITALAERKPQDAAFSTASGFFQNTVSAKADYELRRNWIVSAGAGYEQDDFQGVSRTDSVTNVEVSTRYFLSRAVGVGLDVAYIDRSSSGSLPGPSYDDIKVGVSLVFQR